MSRRTPVEGDLPALGLLRESFTVEPRLALRWSPWERLTVKVAFGRYAPPPQSEDLSAAFGTPSLGVARSTHLLAGVTVRPTPALAVEVTTFASWSEGLAMRASGESPRLAEALTDTGEGRAYGAQILVRQELARGFLGWLSYSVMRSERRASSNDPWRLFDYDQTHVLTALFTWEVGRGFEVGLRFRYATGMPRTPVTGAWFDATRDRWQPLFGAQNADRLPDFIPARRARGEDLPTRNDPHRALPGGAERDQPREPRGGRVERRLAPRTAGEVFLWVVLRDERGGVDCARCGCGWAAERVSGGGPQEGDVVRGEV